MTTLFNSGFIIPDSNAALPRQSLCPGDLPLVLFPVRLETRFFTLPGSITELRVRIFPDKIHLDSHEPELTPDEHTWGQHYWRQDWLAADDARARQDAWSQLADRFGAARASWIARMLRPTNATQRPSGDPIFPSVTLTPAGQDSSWRRAPQARLLPDRWVAIVHSAGRAALMVTGSDIRRPLAVGPDPNAPPPDAQTETAILNGDAVALDPGMKWLVDFDEAQAAGMALRITIPAATLTAGLNSLVVFGVARSLSPAETSTQLANLFDAHHYTEGLEFLRQGAPTNNTDDRRASYSSNDPPPERSFALETATGPMLADSNAQRVGAALGLPANRIEPTLGRIGRGLERDEANLRSMSTALWPVGWGYFLNNMIGAEAGLTPQLIDWARNYFLNFVRSAGPYPVLRCGSQPYGVLPVTSLDLWQTSETQDTWLKDMLISLRDNVWRPALGSVARVGTRNPPDPDADLVDVMQTDGLSSGYDTRSIFGLHFLQHLRAFLTHTIPSSNSEPAQTALLQQLGISWRSRLTHAWNTEWAWRVSAPLIQAGEVSPWTTLAPDFIGDLLIERNIANLINLRPEPNATDNTTSLLKVLLRHALLREIAQATAAIAANAPGGNLSSLLRDAELIDLVTGAQPTMHWQRQLNLTVPAITGSSTIRQFLEGLTAFTVPAVASLGQFRSSLGQLQTLDTEALLYLMQGTLDLSSHRLDAWITSFATKRLAAMRTDRPAGLVVGAYGWVENLKPMPASSVAQVSPPPGESAPLFAAMKDSGFIHAPSMTHASAAALLRNAHLGPSSVPEQTGPFAIDLSSSRVREASNLLYGVRQGQPLGALLGYRIERNLHDASLDRFIAPLRKLAPLVARAREDNEAPVESIAANNVVDGLVLNRRWKEQQAIVTTELNRLTPTAAEMKGVVRELQNLDAAIDGLSDALTAETAYQMARGNTARVASTLSAIARGDAPPPELEVARIPRSGKTLTHRLLVLMNGSTSLSTPGWPQWNTVPRSHSEQVLNFWAGKLLGDATKVRCTALRLDDSTGAVLETRAFPLSDLALTPLDMVYGVEAAGELTEIEQLVLYFAKRGGAPANYRLQHTRPTDLAAGEITLFDALEQARAIRKLLSSTRGAEPEDLNPPERTGQGVIDLADLETRANRAENALTAAHTALNNQVTKPVPNAEALRTALLKMGRLGIEPAVPVSATGDDVPTLAALVRQGQALLKMSAARLDQSTTLRNAAAASDPRARRGQLMNRIRAVFGPSFTVVPRFACDSAAAAELASALSASTQKQGGDALAVNTWFARCARVRNGVAQLGACLQNAEVLGVGVGLNLKVAQLPFVGGERWVGLAPTPGQALPPSKLSVLVQVLGTIQAAQPLAGLLVDEWVEVVPSTHETTALAFQFDVPDSCAPQSVLIAVPPVAGQEWDTEILRRVLMETLDLAKLRAVDTRLLNKAAQHLPGIYLAFNAADHAVSTDFKPLTQ